MLSDDTVRELAANAARGAALLDERDPGWWHADRAGGNVIDLGRLNMHSAMRCVVAQWAGRDYYRGLDALGVDRGDSYRYGFTAQDPAASFVEAEFFPRYGLLAELWRDMIVRRRAWAAQGASAGAGAVVPAGVR